MPKDAYRTGGTRGGANEFKWEDIAGLQKERDNYLGACLKASVRGRRDLDRDFFWYNKATDHLGRKLGGDADLEKARRRLELLERKRADAEALADALGETAESRKRAAEVELEVSELKTLLERGGVERDRLYSERIEGLGAAPAQRHGHLAKDGKIQEEVARQEAEARERHLVAAINARKRCTTTEAEEAAMLHATHGRGDVGFVHDADADARDVKRARKVEKKAEKKEKKAAKKEKKKDKKAAKKAAKKNQAPDDHPSDT